jgi:hypothetical protein
LVDDDSANFKRERTLFLNLASAFSLRNSTRQLLAAIDDIIAPSKAAAEYRSPVNVNVMFFVIM